MKDQINNKICSVANNYIEFYKGCYRENLEFDKLPGITFIGNNNQKAKSLKYIINTLENNDYISYVKSPLNIREDFARKSPSKNNSLDIPKYLHAVWITDKDSPKAINSQLENFIAQSAKLKKYQPVIWTNIETDTVNSLNPELDWAHIHVKNIAETQTKYKQLLNFIVDPKSYINCSGSYKVVLIDVVKYLVMESQGGILVDLNFNFSDNLTESDLESHNFLSTYHNQGLDYLIENSFFIASKHHPIFKGTLDLIDDIINNPSCALTEYRAYPLSPSSTYFLTMMTLSLSYTKYNNIDGNKDAFQGDCNYLPYKLISSLPPEIISQIDKRSLGINQKNPEAQKKQEEHYKIEEKLYSINQEEFNEYVRSYLDILSYKHDRVSCSGVEIGKDDYSGSWQ